MKALLWKSLLFVPLGALVCYFILSQFPGLEQIEAEQKTQRTISAARANSSSGKLSAVAVLAIDPHPTLPRKTLAPLKVTTHSLTQRLADTKQYKTLFDQLKVSPEGQTPEGWYAQHVILRACATITDRQASSPRPPTPDERRQRFMSDLSASDPQRDLRAAAFEQLDENRCLGLEGLTISEVELSKLLESAANAGIAQARALLVEKDMWAAYRVAGNGANDDGPGLPVLTDAQIEALKGAVLSKDPEAMVIAGRVLSNSIYDLTLQIGPQWQNIDQSAFHNAWQLLGCDYGMDCAGNHPKILSACAYQGHCGATSLADNLYFYGNSPHQSQLLERYRLVLGRIVESGDWSQIKFTRGGNPVGNRYFVRGGP